MALGSDSSVLYCVVLCCVGLVTSQCYVFLVLCCVRYISVFVLCCETLKCCVVKIQCCDDYASVVLT